MSPRPKSESAVLSVSLPPSVEKIHFKTAVVQKLRKQNNCFFINFLPELSSLTSDDIVLVMESAAMSRSFLKFLLGPLKHTRTFIFASNQTGHHIHDLT